MAANRKVEATTGFGRSDKQSIVIASGQTTNATPADLLRGFSFVVISCANCANIAAGSKLSLQAADNTGDTPIDVWSVDGAAIWNSGILPTSGSFRFLVSAALGAQLIKPVLSVATSGAVTIDITGFDPTVTGT